MATSLKIIALTIGLFLVPAHAEHRHYDAHVHGAAKLDIAIDDLNGKIEFRAAAEGVLGFEHKPKSAPDQKKLTDTKQIFVQSMEKMVNFDSALLCHLEKIMVDQIPEKDHQDNKEAAHKKDAEHLNGEHSDFVATFKVLCQKSPLGSRLKLDFSRFKDLHDIDVTILIGNLQKSLELKGKPADIVLQ